MKSLAEPPKEFYVQRLPDSPGRRRSFLIGIACCLAVALLVGIILLFSGDNSSFVPPQASKDESDDIGTASSKMPSNGVTSEAAKEKKADGQTDSVAEPGKFMHPGAIENSPAQSRLVLSDGKLKLIVTLPVSKKANQLRELVAAGTSVNAELISGTKRLSLGQVLPAQAASSSACSFIITGGDLTDSSIHETFTALFNARFGTDGVLSLRSTTDPPIGMEYFFGMDFR